MDTAATLTTWFSLLSAAVAGFALASLCGNRHRRTRPTRPASPGLEQETLDAIGALVMVVDARGGIVHFNRECERALGRSRSDVLGAPFWTVLELGADLEAARRYYSDPSALAAELPEHVESVVVAPDGSRHVVEWTLTRVFDDDGRIRWIVGSGFDVTEPRAAQARQADTLARLEATLEATRDGILAMDLTGRPVTCNRRFAEIWGIPPEVLAAPDRLSWLHSALHRALDPGALSRLHVGSIRNPERETCEVIELVDGRVIERTSRPQRVNDEVTGIVVGYRDVSERVRAERALLEQQAAQRALIESNEQLRHAQKMEAIGRLAGGVAHDFNNVLTAILGYASLLERRLARQGPPPRELDEIRKASERAARLTRQLLTFSRRQVLAPRPLDLGAAVLDVLPLLRPIIGEDVEVSVLPPTRPVHVLADRGQIEQTILNLAVNARDAMPRGGTIVLATRTVAIGPERARGLDVQPGRYVALEVRDSGTGMTPEVAARVFEPFFTTKDAGKGTGLGLSTVFGVARQSGGAVEVESAPGRGSTFRVLLPELATVTTTTPVAPTADMPRERTGSEAVLLVEDEDLLRRLTREILESQGYRVLAARDGIEAIRLAGSAPDSIDLVLTDVVMPGMSGRELAEHLSLTHPGTRVVFMSGYTDDEVVRLGVRERSAEFLAKPFSPEQLADKLREVLDGKAEHPAIASGPERSPRTGSSANGAPAPCA